jgi:antitoxin HigA-1
MRPASGMRPIHPGEILRQEFLEPYRMTAYRLAKGLGMQQTAVAQILSGRRGITPATALRLSRFFGNSPHFWLNLQAAYDLKTAEAEMAGELAAIEAYRHEGSLFLDGEEVYPDEPAEAAAEAA